MGEDARLLAAQTAASQRPRWRDRGVVIGALVVLVVISWWYTVAMALDLDSMLLPRGHAWGGAELAMLFVMWVVMMAAMMLPSVTPTVLLFSRMRRTQGVSPGVLSHTGWFVLGYLSAWTGFSIVATVLQWALHEAGLLSPAMVGTSARFGGVLLLIAGVYQFTSLKYACLSHCQSPLGFIMGYWREGARGAFAMGLRHGIYCVGCCWALMALLFVTGVMNLLWIALISVFVLLEKALPAGQAMARASGTLLILGGLWMLFFGAAIAPGA